MTPTKEQAAVALNLLKELSQERINSMGPATQQIVAPQANAALQLLAQALEEHFKSSEPEPSAP